MCEKIMFYFLVLFCQNIASVEFTISLISTYSKQILEIETTWKIRGNFICLSKVALQD